MPKRASSGPASRIEARIRAQSAGIERLGPHAARVDPHEVGAGPLDRGAEIDEEREHGLDVPDARDVVEVHRAVGEEGRGEDRQRGVLVAGGTDGTRAADGRRERGSVEAWPKLITESDASSGARGLRDASYRVVFQRWRDDPSRPPVPLEGDH